MKHLMAGMITAMALTGGMAQAKTEIRVASIAPEGTPWIQQLQTWEKNVEAATNGELDIVIYPSAQLGNEFDTFKQVQRGRIDAASVSGGTLGAFVKEVSLMSTPFLFDTTDVLDCVYDGPLGQKLSDLVSEKKVDLLQWGETGWVHIYAKDDLSNVADAKGYKVRIAPHDMSRTLWQSAGANGTELPYAETPAALQTGLVKAGESAEISFVAFGLGKVAPHLIMTHHLHQAGGVVISQRTLAKLSPEHRKILKEGLPSLAETRGAIRQMGKVLVGKYESAGGPVHRLSDEQRNAWKATVQPNWPGFVKSLGSGAEALWPDLLEARKNCGA